MAYATQQQLIERYGEQALLVAADRGAGAIDTDAVSRALDDATAEIETYVARRYDLPLPMVPTILQQLACDIAFYRLSADAGSGTDEKRKRYEDAKELLARLADGSVRLGFQPQTRDAVVLVSGPKRLFSRRTFGRLS